MWSDTFITEREAQALLQSAASAKSSSAASAEPTDQLAADGNGASGGTAGPAETYEVMNLPPSKYLCAIPVVAPPAAPNQTAAELAKAEEARELSLASARGWELLRGLDGTCLYFISGWWSYSFCYGDEIVQFHALPSGPKGGPPVRDPNTAQYVLGRVTEEDHHFYHHTRPSSTPAGKGIDGGEGGNAAASDDQKLVTPPNTELQTRGDQRYLLQRLEGGTVCDLTGRDRTVEVQYHCQPGLTSDYIGGIKEVTTCTYLMIVYTPRLCQDVAFLPPKESRANTISCRQIVSTPAEERAWLQMTADRAQKLLVEGKGATAAGGDEAVKGGDGRDAAKDKPAAHHRAHVHAKDGAKAHAATPPVPDTAVPAARQQQQQQQGTQRQRVFIGGVEVGARRVLGSGQDGRPVPRLEPPRKFLGAAGSTRNRHNIHNHDSAGSGLRGAKGARIGDNAAPGGAGGGEGGGGGAAGTSNDQVDDLAPRPGEQRETIAEGRVVADETNGEPTTKIVVEALNDEQLRALDLSPELVEELKRELQQLAGDRGWRLEVVEAPDIPREIRGTVDGPEDEEDEDGKNKAGDDGAQPEGSEEQFFQEEL